ncbi:MAG: hypothetical protein HDR18_05050 [Lachnospiraceae bacterium]|nr:hypothetical protein [Lachnospiraceae bacterium]
MMEKELSELTRQELLELLLLQGQKQRQLEEQIAEMTEQIYILEQCFNTKDRLIVELEGYLDENDEQIAALKKNLSEKDSQIERMNACLEQMVKSP